MPSGKAWQATAGYWLLQSMISNCRVSSRQIDLSHIGPLAALLPWLFLTLAVTFCYCIFVGAYNPVILTNDRND
jgi:hypothetical protein